MQNFTGLHFGDRFVECADNRGNVRIGVRGGEEARKAFEEVDTLFPQVVVKQTAQWEISGEAEIKYACEVFNARGNAAFFKKAVQCADQRGGFCSELLLELRALVAEMLEHSFHGRQSEWVPVERARKERYSDRWIGVVAELPGAAV